MLMLQDLQSYTNDKEMRISSREVADMLQVRWHSNIIRKINQLNEHLLDSNVDTFSYWIESSYIDNKGRTKKEYLVTKKGCELLAHKTTGEVGTLFTIKYIERFKEMEQALIEAQGVPSYTIVDPIQRALRWIDEQKEKERLSLKVKEQQDEIDELQPKGLFYDTVMSTEKWLSMNEVAKVLGKPNLGRNKIFKLLRDKKILNKHNVPYQRYVDDGLFKMVETNYKINDNKKNTTLFRIGLKCVVSQKGVEYINNNLLCEVDY